MKKGFLQLGLMSAALVTAAIAEAAVPIWLADQVSATDHRMTAQEYGSQAAWRACLTANDEAHCTQKYAALRSGVLQIKDYWPDDNRHCPAQTATIRHFAGAIKNISRDVTITSASWSAGVAMKPFVHKGGGILQSGTLAPGAEAVQCLFSIDFGEAEKAQRFDRSGAKLTLIRMLERGLQEKA